MRGVASRAIVLTIVFLLSFQFPFSSPSLNEETQLFFTDQEVISSTEVRVHNLGQDWNENQVLEWSPNHLEYNRTIQFSILIEGINSTEVIESMTLNMTWIYNVSSGDPLLSENLSVSNLEPHENGLFMYFNYTYPLDIFHDEYEISLDTLVSGGTLHTFDHEGINVIAYDMHLEPMAIDFDSKLLFANNQVTSLELFIQNTGSVYTDIEFQIIFLSQLPSNWNPPNIFISDSDLSGGQNSTALFEFQTPNDAYPSKDPMPVIEFQLSAEFEDFTGQMVEFYNVNYSLESELVPLVSNANISVFRTNFSTDLVKNNYQQTDPNADFLETSLVSLNSLSMEFFFDVQNYGFTRSTFELGVFSLDDVDIEIYSQFNEDRPLLEEDGGLTINDVEPLEIVSFRCHITFSMENQIDTYPISISVDNSNSGVIFDLDLNIYFMTIQNIFIPSSNISISNYLQNISTLQNESVELFLIIPWNPLLEASYFQNNWIIEVSIINPEFDIISQLELSLLENNTLLSNPYLFSIARDQFFKIDIGIDEDVTIDDYYINIKMEQINDDGALMFENQVELSILENLSLSEPDQNNSNNGTINDNSDNSSTNNSTIPDSNDLTNDSTNSSATNTQNQVENSTNITQENNTNITQNQNGNSESDDSTDSQGDETNSWFYVSVALVVISLISILIIRRKVSSKNKNIEDLKDKTIVEINPSIVPKVQLEAMGGEELTVLHQWTDNNGYTWKQMSDRSMLWWNGQEWVPVNYNR